MSLKQEHLQKLRDRIRLKHFSLATERNYVFWVSKFWDAARRMPEGMSREKKIETFLTAEAKRGCAASTQNQAFNAIIFFFKHVIKEELGDIRSLRAKRRPVMRVAPTRERTLLLLDQVQDVAGYPTKLIARLLYGCGLRVCEPLNIRIKDIDLDRSQIILVDTKGGACRKVALPCALANAVIAQIKVARAFWEYDQINKVPVPLPHLYYKKHPAAARSWAWYWLFPARKYCTHPRTGDTVRWRVHEVNVQRAVKAAAAKVGLEGLITPHNLRHAYATHVIDAGASVRDVQSALGHKDLETTMGYIHPDGLRVRSPIDL